MYLLQTFVEASTSEKDLNEITDFLIKLGARLLIDMTFMFLLIRFIYFKIYKQGELFFTFFAFNLVIFFMCYFLNKVELSMGAAFGLFAVFGMLRYRTEDISIKDMTYLFLVIAMGLISAVLKIEKIKFWTEVLIIGLVNSTIIFVAWLLESNLLMKRELAKVIMYENIELIKAEREEEFLIDLRTRTGLDIHRYSIVKIDFLRDMAQVKIYYREPNSTSRKGS
ncbi:MAG: DUF4956 domain-containing protein [Bacteroidota bacterium]|jgi:hypothetical protein